MRFPLNRGKVICNFSKLANPSIFIPGVSGFGPLQAFGRFHDPLRVQDLNETWESTGHSTGNHRVNSG